MAAAGFFSRYLNGVLPNVLSASLNKTFPFFLYVNNFVDSYIHNYIKQVMHKKNMYKRFRKKYQYIRENPPHVSH